MVFAQSELSFLKTVRNQYNKATARQWNPRTPRIAENIDAVNDLALGQDGAPGTHKTTRQIARETGILQRSVGRIIHKDIHPKTKTSCLKKRF